jgi:GNAT superfamily N-acetyltransferase
MTASRHTPDVDAAERIASGFVEAERRRLRMIPGSTVVDLDGVVVALSNLADPELNGGFVTGVPADPAATIAEAVRIAVDHGQTPALEVEPARFPEVVEALAAQGFTGLFGRPGMAVDLDALWRPPMPATLQIRPVADAGGLAAAAQVDRAAFGSSPGTAAALYPRMMLREEGVRAFVGTMDGAPVAAAVGHLHEGSVGVFGVAVVPSSRGHGVGTAMTAAAATAFGCEADLAWLHPDEGTRAMYERLGFREVSAWEVWTRRDPPT